MKVEAKIFELLTLFFLAFTAAYAIFTYQSRTGIEWVGTAAMALSAGLSLICGAYFRFVSRRIDLRPEDFEDAEVADGAGELGFFSPHSIWPILVATSLAVAVLSLVFFKWWLIVPSAVFILITAFGLVFEYYLGPEKH